MEEPQKIIAQARKRFIAYFLDIVPITLTVCAVFYFFLGFDVVLGNFRENSFSTEARIDFLTQRNYIRNITLLCFIIYCTIMESTSRQGTFGKQIVGIIVVNKEGQRMSFDESIKRNSSKVLSALVFGLGFIWILFSKKKQGWHDLIAKTFVIEKPKYIYQNITSEPSES